MGKITDHQVASERKDLFGIGTRLRQVRGTLSQRNFAQKIGIPFRSYQRYEAGHRIPPLRVFDLIGNSCSVDVTWLIRGKCDPPVPLGQTTRSPSRDLEMLISRLVGLYAKEFDQFCRILEEADPTKLASMRATFKVFLPRSK
jgi:transcriptional regulator with XRE-family HTH domain